MWVCWFWIIYLLMFLLGSDHEKLEGYKYDKCKTTIHQTCCMLHFKMASNLYLNFTSWFCFEWNSFFYFYYLPCFLWVTRQEERACNCTLHVEFLDYIELLSIFAPLPCFVRCVRRVYYFFTCSISVCLILLGWRLRNYL